MRQYHQTVIYKNDCTYPIYDEVDVVVVGGGPAGMAAAETAARIGLRTLLVERHGFLGGAAVAGYSGTIGGLYYASENPKETGPRQCVYGWTERFYQELKRRKGVTEPQIYGKTYLVPHDPQVWKEAAEDMVLAAGAHILYHTNLFGVIMDGESFQGIIVDTKSGLAQIRARVVIDATGDGDVIYRAGLNYTMGENGTIQNPTMIFRLGGVNVPKFFEYWGEDTICPEKVTEQMISANGRGYHLPRLKGWVYYTPRPNELYMNVTLICGADGRGLNVCDPDDHSEAEIMARRQVQEYAGFFKQYIPGCEDSFVNDLSMEVGVRQTRSIQGIERLRDADIEAARKRPDGIARSPWPVELHNGERPYMFWLVDDYYEIPYGALVPVKGENIIVAGRNLSAEHRALASCRVTAQCFEYGHAAGLAAGIAIEQHMKFREIDGKDVRAAMNRDGSRLDG